LFVKDNEKKTMVRVREREEGERTMGRSAWEGKNNSVGRRLDKRFLSHCNQREQLHERGTKSENNTNR
jgi:hypothetical protein